jgi:hypothetical protein
MKNLIIIACVFCTTTHVYSQTWSDYGTVQPSFDLAGWHANELQLSGNGSMFVIGSGYYSKAAVYKRVNSAWSQIGSTLSGGSYNTEFYGKTAKISDDGNTIAIGAPNANTSGLVYIYRWNGTDWDQLGDTIWHVGGNNPYDKFGEDIALSGDGNVVAIGANEYDYLSSFDSNWGLAIIYTWSGTSWNKKGQSLVGEGSNDKYGLDLDLSYDGNIVAIASPNNDGAGSNAGHARIYEYSNTQWTQLGNDLDGEDAGDNLGTDIAIAENGHTVIVGLKDCDNDNDGCAKVYNWDGTTWNQHGQTIFGVSPTTTFGYCVAISESANVIAIGDHGQDSVSVYNFNGTHWTTVGQKIVNNYGKIGTTLTMSNDGTVIASSKEYRTAYLYQVDASFTVQPTDTQTNAPTKIPTDIPSDIPTDIPSEIPTYIPSDSPTAAPTCYSVSTTATTKTITIICNITGIDLSTICGLTCTTDHSNVTIIGQGIDPNTNHYWTWHDFQFLYTFQYGTLHFQNLRVYTETINGYAIYSKYTQTTMENVVITGYSGRQGETSGGAMRIRNADYSILNHDETTPTLKNVSVDTNCRGFRIQDSIGVYTKDCTAKDNTDNSFYFAAGTYTSASGCHDSTFDNCIAINSGQTAFMTIGGTNNTFKNCVIDTSRGAGLYIYNSDSVTLVQNVSFTDANTAHVTTPYGGNTDDADGASIAMSVLSTDINATLNIDSCMFYGGGVLGQKTPENANVDAPNSIVLANTGPGYIEFINGRSHYDATQYDADTPWVLSSLINTSILDPFATYTPTDVPSDIPSDTPSDTPSDSPTDTPSDSPTDTPTDSPSNLPSDSPTTSPTDSPSTMPSDTPTTSPTDSPSNLPSDSPTTSPMDSPSNLPSDSPTASPTDSPSNLPSDSPTTSPTDSQSNLPSDSPTTSPTDSPSNLPSDSPTTSPTEIPSNLPSDSPTTSPTEIPSNLPTGTPTDSPTNFPTPELILDTEVPKIEVIFATNDTTVSQTEIMAQLATQYESTVSNVITDKITSSIDVSFFTKISQLPISETRRRRGDNTNVKEIKVETIVSNIKTKEPTRTITQGQTLNNCTLIANNLIPNATPIEYAVFLGICSAFDDRTAGYLQQCVSQKMEKVSAASIVTEGVVKNEDTNEYASYKLSSEADTRESNQEFCLNNIGRDNIVSEYETYQSDGTPEEFLAYWTRISKMCLSSSIQECILIEASEIALLTHMMKEDGFTTILKKETIAIDITNNNGNNITLEAGEPIVSTTTFQSNVSPKEDDQKNSNSIAIIAGGIAGGIAMIGVIGYIFYSKRRSANTYSNFDIFKSL